MDPATTRRNRVQQEQWYGESIGDTVARLTAALGLTQGQLAAAAGLSPAMLSQLSSGARAKIANPAVLARMQALVALADDPAMTSLPRAELAGRVAAVAAQGSAGTGALTSTSSAGGRGAEAVQAVLRAVASATEVEGAAALLDAVTPALAEVLRVYGLGRTSEAREHFTRVTAD